MIKSPPILTRRSVFRAGAGLAVAATATRLITPASAQAEDARQAGAEASKRQWLLSLQDRRLPGDRGLGWLWTDTDPADPRYERL